MSQRSDDLAADQVARDELWEPLRRCKMSILAVFVFSGVVNILGITGSVFMLETYDRVMPSRSVPSLIGFSLIAIFAYLFYSWFDIIRSRLQVQLSNYFSAKLNWRVFQVLATDALNSADRSRAVDTMRDFEMVRNYLASGGISSFCDLPWVPFYLMICALMHPMLGLVAALGACMLVGFMFLSSAMLKRSVADSAPTGSMRSSMVESTYRNAETIRAMGMLPHVYRKFSQVDASYQDAQSRGASVSLTYGAISRAFRLLLQSMILAVGAYLVITEKATGGIMIAASILSARALAPIDLVIAQWRGFAGVRQAWRRLIASLARVPVDTPKMRLPNPRHSIVVQGLSIRTPDQRREVVAEIGFRLGAGEALAVVGPSGSGKSSLVRGIVGAWPIGEGTVRIDGAELSHWSLYELGQHIGYLPQQIDLFAGTIGENISRHVPDARPDEIIRAAMAAGCHELIQQFPEGYDSRLGESGAGLSAGQRQRIGLARALFRDPFLVVLDEPNSNLDGAGEMALAQAIEAVKSRGGVVIIVSHRPVALNQADYVMVMRDGRMVDYGPTRTIMQKLMRPKAATPQVVTETARPARPAALTDQLSDASDTPNPQMRSGT